MTSDQQLRTVSLSLYASLLVLVAIQAWLVVIQQGIDWHLVFPVKILPLLGFMPFLLQNSKRAYIWMGFVLCLYFMQPVVELVSGVNPLISALLITNIVALFISSIFFIRRYTG